MRFFEIFDFAVSSCVRDTFFANIFAKTKNVANRYCLFIRGSGGVFFNIKNSVEIS